MSQLTSINFDKIVYDLKSCYEDAPEIKSLTRTMIYNRLPAQNVIIEDEASFTKSSDFEVAITSKGDWVQTSVSEDKKIVQGKLTYSNQILKVTITGTDPINIDEVAYTEFGNSFTRVAVKTANLVSYAKISATFNHHHHHHQSSSNKGSGGFFFRGAAKWLLHLVLSSAHLRINSG